MRYSKLYLVSLAVFFAIDMLWGTFLSVSVSCIGFIAGKRLI